MHNDWMAAKQPIIKINPIEKIMVNKVFRILTTINFPKLLHFQNRVKVTLN